LKHYNTFSALCQYIYKEIFIFSLKKFYFFQGEFPFFNKERIGYEKFFKKPLKNFSI